MAESGFPEIYCIDDGGDDDGGGDDDDDDDDGDGDGDGDGDLAKAMELKEKLQTLIDRIVFTDDYSTETIDQALKTLYDLKNLKNRQKVNLGNEVDAVPANFRCPISGEIMSDPVILSNGMTYDRPFIENWLKKGCRTCPQTKEVLENTVLTPNVMVQKLISEWCHKVGIEQPIPVPNSHKEVITNADRHRFNLLLKKISSSSIPDQKKAANFFRLLSKQMRSIRTFFGESRDNITRLLSPLTLGSVSSDPTLHEDLITTVLNVSIPDDNKKLVAQNCVVLPLLIESLDSGTLVARTNAAAAIFTLSALDSNKVLFGRAGAIKRLIGLLEEVVEPLGKKDVAQAIFKLCLLPENRIKAFRDGAVRAILNNIKKGNMVDELLSILSLLSKLDDAVKNMYELGAIPCLYKIMRESKCERVKENCITVIHAIFFEDESYWQDVAVEEIRYKTIKGLAEDGTLNARTKAKAIREKIFLQTSK